MDIWAWVNRLQDDLREAGHGRVADLIDRIPDDVNSQRSERVAAAMPEALAAARSLKNPWLEVFFRHWGLQGRTETRSEGEVALQEASSLLEFAHREETRGCPQSVCVTQDIAKCYANVDGLGWVPERLAVCEETLARIDPTWPCFDCISREYAIALEDAGRASEAVAFLDRQAAALSQAGEEIGPRFRWQQAEAVWLSGRPEEALALYEALEGLEHDQAEADRMDRAVDRARILVELGRLDEAGSAVPQWEELQPSQYDDWTAAALGSALVKRELNTWRLGAQFQEAVDHMVRVGAHRKAFRIAERQARLALARGAPWTAARALAVAQSRLPLLRAQEDAAASLVRLTAAVAQAPRGAAPPVPAEALPDYLKAQKDRDPEQEAQWLLGACLERPDDAELAMMAGDALSACGLEQESSNHLGRFVAANPTARPVVYGLLDRLLKASDDAGVERLVALLDPLDPPTAHWCRACRAHHQERWAEVGKHAARVLELEDVAGARRLWASAAMASKDFSSAVRLRKELLARSSEEDRNLCFDLMTAASAFQDWETVRQIAARIGMELGGTEGVVEEDWGPVLMSIDEEGESRTYFGQRTGPATARILEPSAPDRGQHCGDWVAFDATPVEAPPEDEEARKDFVYTFRVIHTLQAGQYDHSWVVDGAGPGDESYPRFRDALRSDGWACWVVSSEEYAVMDPENPGGESLPGILVFVATPKGTPALELHRALKERTATWPHPVSWLALAEHVGADVDHHRGVVERYGL
jgi:tetratricopeptide (TPR) repeat protein